MNENNPWYIGNPGTGGGELRNPELLNEAIRLVKLRQVGNISPFEHQHKLNELRKSAGLPERHHPVISETEEAKLLTERQDFTRQQIQSILPGIAARSVTAIIKYIWGEIETSEYKPISLQSHLRNLAKLLNNDQKVDEIGPKTKAQLIKIFTQNNYLGTY